MSEHELVVEQRASRQSSSAVMAMVIFVASEAMFFMAFFGVYASTYSDQPVWPPRDVPLLAIGLPTAADSARSTGRRCSRSFGNNARALHAPPVATHNGRVVSADQARA